MAGTIEKTALEIVKESIDANQSFVVEAGAGSGKTWTLIESIKYILSTKQTHLEKFNKQIACITYTNVAKDEITERLDNNPFVLVLTIHEFLWHVIKNFQKELKMEILKYNAADQRKHVVDLDKKIVALKIEYSQYGRNFEKGKITHEDVLAFSNSLFNEYPKLPIIVSNQFPYLFIDEYQDTEPRIATLLLDKLLAPNKNKILLGFYGDSMQKIYNQGIGKIPPNYFSEDFLKYITKNENYRCSKKVIELLAKIRPQLVQTPSGNNLEGKISFIQCNNNLSNAEENYNATLQFLKDRNGWDLRKNTKILLLTHRGIANKLGYENLLSVYDAMVFGRDRLLNREERFADLFLNRLEKLVQFYEQKNYREFIKNLGLEGFKINFHKDKKDIQELMEYIIEIRKTKTVKEVMDFVFDNRILVKPIKIEEFQQEINKDELDEDTQRQKEYYDNLMRVQYKEYITINEYIEDFTPYSTKHGVKGAEFENVLVVIDDPSWNQYKFNDVFANITTNQGRYERTLNLLYVCCSRAKNNLALLSLSKMDLGALHTITTWFGEENVYDITTLT